jgi:type IV pilus assembly protein PilV
MYMKLNFKFINVSQSCSSSKLRTQHGFSLLEVLISILILSFGVLGMVGLQAAALQANREARLQSVAGTLARELAEMMRGNKDIGNLTAGNPYLGSFSGALTPPTPAYCLNVATGTTACTNTTALANSQMTEWLSRVSKDLPGARVEVCQDSAPFDASGVPRWACAAGATGDTLVIKIGWTRGSTDKTLTGAAAFEKATVPSVVFPITPGS